MYVGSQTRPCRNGPGCYYLKRDRCFFYHPPSHYQTRSSSFTPISIRPSNFGMNRGQNLQSLLKTIEVLKFPSKTIAKKEEEQQQIFFMDKGTKVPLISIQTTIKDKEKSWFFERVRHFHHYPKNKHQTCSICLSDFSEDKLVSQLYCDHGFHRSCIEKWIQNNIACPLCKRDFTKHQCYQKMSGYKKYEPKLSPSFSLIESIYNSLDLPPINFESDQDDQLDFYEHHDYYDQHDNYDVYDHYDHYDQYDQYDLDDDFADQFEHQW